MAKNSEITKTRVALSSAWFVFALALGVGVGIGDYYASVSYSVISNFFNQKMYEVVDDGDENEDTEYFKTEFTSDEDLYEASSAVAKQVEAEGLVLLKNEDDVMPLGDNKKISIFSASSVDFVYGGTGSGQINVSTVDTIKDAFEDVGYEVNETLWQFYEDEGYSRTTGSQDTYPNTFLINEVPVENYTAAVISSFSEYNDAAVVVLSRSGGEGADLIHSTEDGNVTDGEDGNYLALSAEEKDMLELVNTNFDTVIVLVNTSNALELGDLEDYENIKSILWVGTPGQSGIGAIAETFTGEVNPSGKLPDTWVYDNMSSPAAMNMGLNYYSNGGEELTSEYSAYGDWMGAYLVYQEGIYVGYRYYETRYEDKVMSTANVGDYDYEDTVIYPFGYGLSYTDFSYSNISYTNEDDSYIISVDVTNTGDVAGKEAVQVYLQKPYTEYDKTYGVEKASVELVAFEKTATLAAGETQTVTIEVEKENFRTYDENGEGTYILEEGIYYLSLGNGAHDALNNILTAKGYGTGDGMDYAGQSSYVIALDVDESDEYATSAVTGNEITNQLDFADLSYYGQETTYVSRNNWSGTMPTTVAPASLTDQMKEDLIPATTIEANEEDEMPAYDQNNGLTLQMFMETDYDSPAWDDLVSQMSLDELYQLVSDGDFHTYAVESISAPGTVHKDGPQGLSTTFTGTVSGQPQAYPCEPIMAATFNKELINRVGELVGEDGLHSGVQGWYAPGANIHRTPYSGRNFEYFSEDSYLTGIMLAEEVAGAQSKGLICFSKHFAFNDQDTARHGVQVWTNEQAGREIYLRGFELSITKANGLGLMSSYSHVGTDWIGGNYNILTNILREEWGFEGVVITDFAAAEYMSISEGILAGNNLWLLAQNNFLGCNANVLEDGWESNPTIVKALQESAKTILYAVSRSSSMNGLSSSSRVVNITPAWVYWLVCLNVVIYLALIGVSGLVIYGLVKRRKKTVDEEE